MTALIYWVTVIPAWYARGHIDGIPGRLFFITMLASVIVAGNLRLHLWFSSRFYESELTWVHGRSGRSIRVADWGFAAALIAGGVLIRDAGSPLTIVLPSVGVGAVVAFTLIEPVTARAAFGSRAAVAHPEGSHHPDPPPPRPPPTPRTPYSTRPGPTPLTHHPPTPLSPQRRNSKTGRTPPPPNRPPPHPHTPPQEEPMKRIYILCSLSSDARAR